MWIYCGGHCNQLAHYMKSHLKLHAVKHYSKLFFQSYVWNGQSKRTKKNWWKNQEKWAIAKNFCRIHAKEFKKKSVSYKTPMKNAPTSGHTEWFGLTVMMAGWISVQNTCLLWMANFWWWNFFLLVLFHSPWRHWLHEKMFNIQKYPDRKSNKFSRRVQTRVKLKKKGKICRRLIHSLKSRW